MGIKMSPKIKWPTGGHFEFNNCEICHGSSHIINPLITMATNEEKLVSAFQEKVSSRSSLIFYILIIFKLSK